jgi:hypothetical protein
MGFREVKGEFRIFIDLLLRFSRFLLLPLNSHLQFTLSNEKNHVQVIDNIR